MSEQATVSTNPFEMPGAYDDLADEPEPELEPKLAQADGGTPEPEPEMRLPVQSETEEAGEESLTANSRNQLLKGDDDLDEAASESNGKADADRHVRTPKKEGPGCRARMRSFVVFLIKFPWVCVSAWLVTIICAIYVTAKWPDAQTKDVLGFKDKHVFWHSMSKCFLMLSLIADTWTAAQTLLYSPYLSKRATCCKPANCLCLKRFASFISLGVYLFSFTITVLAIPALTMMTSASTAIGLAVGAKAIAGTGPGAAEAFDAAYLQAQAINPSVIWGSSIGPSPTAKLSADNTAWVDSMTSCITAFVVMIVSHIILMVCARDNYLLALAQQERTKDLRAERKVALAKAELQTRRESRDTRY